MRRTLLKTDPSAEQLAKAAAALSESLPSSLPRVLAMALEGRFLPLKIGIDKDLEERIQMRSGTRGFLAAEDLIVVDEFLRLLTREPGYRAALLAPGAQRHDLDGKPVGPVSAAATAGARDKRGANAAAKKARARLAAEREAAKAGNEDGLAESARNRRRRK